MPDAPRPVRRDGQRPESGRPDTRNQAVGCSPEVRLPGHNQYQPRVPLWLRNQPGCGASVAEAQLAVASFDLQPRTCGARPQLACCLVIVTRQGDGATFRQDHGARRRASSGGPSILGLYLAPGLLPDHEGFWVVAPPKGMSDGFDPFDPEEWGDRPECNAFEAALEMRARGALASDALPVLDAHLTACDACRDYAARLRRVDASLVATAVAPDWRALREKMDAALKETHRTPWLLACIGVAVAALYSALSMFFTRRLPPVIVLLLPIPLLVSAGVFGVYLRRRRLRRLLAEPDAIAAYRRWVEMGVKGLRRMRWWIPLYSIIPAFRAVGNYQRFAEGDPAFGPFAVMNAVAFLAFIYVMIWCWRHLRRLKAELAELH